VHEETEAVKVVVDYASMVARESKGEAQGSIIDTQ
jgi:hypothetical protein